MRFAPVSSEPLDDEGMEGYDVAQVCLNGHVANSSTLARPQFNKRFCEECGSPTITQCPACEANIRGKYHYRNVIGGGYDLPGFCFSCGASFPWTAARIQAARELADSFNQLTDSDREQLKLSLDDLIRDTPRTPLAQTRFRTILAKVGKEGVDGMRSVLVDVVSEVVKKSIFGP